MKPQGSKGRTKVYVFFALALLILALIAALFLARELEKRKFKLIYNEAIVSYSEEYELDPYLVAAVIHVESGNRPAVISRSGAVGLMQIMPETGGWIAGKLDLDEFNEQMLKEPSLNIEFGCWYLRFLLNKYDHDIVHTLAAYNAGQGTVDKWLADERYSSSGKLIDIPYEETDNYVVRVQHAYEKYKALYKNAF